MMAASPAGLPTLPLFLAAANAFLVGLPIFLATLSLVTTSETSVEDIAIAF
jgi:hypothetical protein